MGSLDRSASAHEGLETRSRSRGQEAAETPEPMKSGLAADFYPPDLEHVPTIAELAKRGLARNEAKSGTRFRVSPEGQKLIYDAMERNAARCRAWNGRKVVAALDGAVA